MKRVSWFDRRLSFDLKLQRHLRKVNHPFANEKKKTKRLQDSAI